MKILFTLISVVVLSINIFAQAPQKMSYQAIIRNNSDQLVSNHLIGMKISILQGSSTGISVYTEIQTPTTNANGLVSIEIGGASGFDAINWGSDIYFIKTEIDPTGSTNYTISGTIQLLSVPYALHARTVENGFSGNYNDLSNKPIGNNPGDLQYWNGTAWELLPKGTTGQVLALNSSNIPSWQNASAPALLAPSATIQAATNKQAFSATLNGTVNANNLSTTCVFEWGLTSSYGNVDTAFPIPVTGASDIAISANLTGLQSATTYHYRINAQNAVNVTKSGDISFTTSLSEPQLSTTAVTSITAFSATSGGEITYDGGSPITAKGVCWSKAQNPTIIDSKTEDTSSNVGFTSSITGLTLSTTYYVRAYATNQVGTGYGDQQIFITDDSESNKLSNLYFIDSIDELIQKLSLNDSLKITTFKYVANMSGVGIAYDAVHEKIYWSDFFDSNTPNGRIWRMNLDGTEEEALITGLLDPFGIALDVEAGKVYWTDGNGNIGRSNLDGSSPEPAIVNVAGGIMRAIAIDKKNSKIYFYEVANDNLYVANLDGTNKTVFKSGIYGYALCLDEINSRIYYNDNYSQSILSANLDGSDVVEVYTNTDPLITRYRVYGIAINQKTKKLYWSSRDTGEINMSNLDGTEKVTLATGIASPRGLFLKN